VLEVVGLDRHRGARRLHGGEAPVGR
jgi:hypothetical protein